jgi:transcriptional regulator with XRE-family HTH domain
MSNFSRLPSPNDDKFPTALAAARQARGISAAELARRAGISPTMVARYENTDRTDHHRPRPHTVALLERVLRGDDLEENAASSLAELTLDALIAEIEQRGFSVTITKPARG